MQEGEEEGEEVDLSCLIVDWNRVEEMQLTSLNDMKMLPRGCGGELKNLE